MNDGADTTNLEDQVLRLQQTSFGAGEAEKGGGAVEIDLVVTWDELGQQILGVLWTNDLSDCCEL